MINNTGRPNMKHFTSIIALLSFLIFYPYTALAKNEGRELNRDQTVAFINCFVQRNEPSYQWLFHYLPVPTLKCFDMATSFHKDEIEYSWPYKYERFHLFTKLSRIKLDSRDLKESDFNGQYWTHLNPELIIWFEKAFLDKAETDSEVDKLLRDLYRKNKNDARTFFLAYEQLTRDRNYFEKELSDYKTNIEEIYTGRNEYLGRYIPPKDYEYDENVSLYSEDDYGYRFRVASGFWLRRGLDGSLPELVRVMNKVMNRYDRKWYRLHRIKL